MPTTRAHVPRSLTSVNTWHRGFQRILSLTGNMWSEKEPSPLDRGNGVGLIVFVLGVGTLLPWSFFMTATQYFNGRLSEDHDSSSNRTVEDHDSSSNRAVEDHDSSSNRTVEDHDSSSNRTVEDHDSSSNRAVEDHDSSSSRTVEDHDSSSNRTVEDHDSSSNRTVEDHDSSSNRTVEDHDSSSKRTVEDHDSSSSRTVEDHDSSSSRTVEDHDSSSSRTVEDHDSSSSRTVEDHDSSSNRAVEDHDSSSNRTVEDHDSSSNRTVEDHDSSSSRTVEDHDSSSNRTVEDHDSSSNRTAPAEAYHMDSYMALLSQLPLLIFTLLTSCLHQHVSERVRVSLSLVCILLLFVLTAALVQVHMDPKTFFRITMATVWFINMSGAVLQGSLFGLVGRLPPRYSTFFMSGQGLAGVFAALAMLLSILSRADGRSAALGYFITPCVATLVTLLCYLLLPHLDFARFYLSRSLNCELERSKQMFNGSDAKDAKELEAVGALRIEEGAEERLSAIAVFKKIWLVALCIAGVFAVTLAVFPAITVRVQTVYGDNKAWAKVFTCVCCFLVFNAMDLVGRIVPSCFQWSRRQSRLLPVAVLLRVAFVPLLMMCNIPNSKLPVLFRHDGCFVLLMALFSFTNGHLASLCMAYAPQFVGAADAVTAGSLMSFFLVLGLASGAALSFVLGSVV